MSESKKVQRGEMVNHPAHYNTNCPKIVIRFEIDGNEYTKEIELECIDVIRNMPTWKGNAVKYLWRAGEKSEQGITDAEKEIEDCEKAIWYIKDRIAELKKKMLF